MELEIPLKLITLFVMTILIVPLNIKFSKLINAVDIPNRRRINTVTMPSSGGISIYLIFNIGLFLFKDYFPSNLFYGLIFSTFIIFITGLIDDIKEINPKQKFVGILVAILLIYFIGDIGINSFTIPLIDYKVILGILSLPITIIWILSITNAVNFIDGLDGLATGTSLISLITMGIVAYNFLPSPINLTIVILISILSSALLGFLPYNFNPAKIFLGDTGALLIGFLLAVISLKGLKNATLLTVFTPMIIIGVPILDTFYAIIRRKHKGQPVSEADRKHLHHKLVSIGLNQKTAVLIIYLITFVFSIIAILFNFSEGIASILLILAFMIVVEFLAEMINLSGTDRKPIWRMVLKIKNKFK